jgi:hypothetical protein
MTIQLSAITFTDEDDIVPAFEDDAIVNSDTLILLLATISSGHYCHRL